MRVRAYFLLLAGAAACASPPAVDESVPRVIYYRSQNPATERRELEFTGSGGATLGLVEHRLREGTTQGRTALIYLHGTSSHAAWFDGPADMLCARGYDVHCLDRRGSGINRENRGFPSGYVDSYETLLADIHILVQSLRGRYDRVYLVGLSWGGKLAMAHALMHPEDCDGLVLITPGLRALVGLTAWQKVKVYLWTHMLPHAAIPIPIRPELFTTTPEFLEKIRRDPLRLTVACTRFFWQSARLDDLVTGRMSRSRLPILVFLAGQDRIIDNAGVKQLLLRGGQKPGELQVLTYEDQTHSIQFDAPQRLVGDILGWLQQRERG